MPLNMSQLVANEEKTSVISLPSQGVVVSSKPSSLAHIDELDGLRGMLALWVALSHIFCWCGFSQFPFALPHLVRSTIRSFWVQFTFAGSAVDTFIILSGFAISYLLHGRQQSYGQFMTGRFFRIYPVYLLCLMAGLSTIYLMSFILSSASWHDNEYLTLYVRPVLDAELKHPLAHLIAHLTLLFGVIPEKIILPGATASLVAPAWSISLEWQYYLLAPFLALYARRPSVLLVLGIISSGNAIYSHFWGSAFLPEKLPLFLIGIGSYHLYVHAESLRSHRYRLIVFAALVAATLAVGWHWLALLIWLIVFGGVLANASEQREWFLVQSRSFLLRPALQFLGKISYPLYLVHWPMIIAFVALLLYWKPEVSSGMALAAMLMIGFPAILFMAWLLHKLVEKPMMQVGKKITRSSPASSASASSASPVSVSLPGPLENGR